MNNYHVLYSYHVMHSKHYIPYNTYVAEVIQMIVMKTRKKVLREPKQRATPDRAGVLLSINNKTDPGWLDELFVKRENIYSRWSIKSAFRGMEVWIAESGVGVNCYAKVGEVNHKSNPLEVKLVDAEKIDMPITVEELRDLGIIQKNTPQTIQYLSKELCKKLDDLFK